MHIFIKYMVPIGVCKSNHAKNPRGSPVLVEFEQVHSVSQPLPLLVQLDQLPRSQSQLVLPALATVPLGQAEHWDTPAELYVFPLQGLQALSPRQLNVPASHARHRKVLSRAAVLGTATYPALQMQLSFELAIALASRSVQVRQMESPG
jgi:hypothetical protein